MNGHHLARELDAIQALEGETDPRVRALLLLVRTFYGQDDLDSYAGVFTEPLRLEEPVPARVDGVVTHAIGDELQHVVLVWIGLNNRKASLSEAIELHDAVVARPEEIERQLLRLRQAKSIISEMRPQRRAVGAVEWRVALVSEKPWSNAEVRAITGLSHLDRWDTARINDLVAARLEPGWLGDTVHVTVSELERLETRAGDRRVVVAPVSGEAVASWPGIESRRLFDLNVRYGLGSGNRVRRSIDSALDDEDQSAFIASHNGLTVVCERIERSETGFIVSNLSVVNGAQSVIALYENRGKLTPELRLLVKFVELGPDDDLASEIAIRSNTQNPVTGRNLRALDASQVELRNELSKRGYHFETRPDIRRRSTDREIKNDLAAQWICAVYLERPWLAVKRTLLFTPDIFQEIFSPATTSEKIILLYNLRRALDEAKPRFPQDLRRAWLLTALTAMYLAGQGMRFDAEDRALLLNPEPGAGDSPATLARLEWLVDEVVSYMSQRHESLVETIGYDNFRVDFKRQRTLVELSSAFVRAIHQSARRSAE